MSDWKNEYIAQRQVPEKGTLVLDHIAHFVPDADAASDLLQKLGFSVTPFSPQSHRPTPDSELVPAGTGNRCVMLKRGYLEFLTPTADTPIANQLRESIKRYTGVHLVAFGTADPEADRARLDAGGFKPAPVLALQRPIGTPDGEETARFGVSRVPAGVMPEGRIQFVQQKTPEFLWQRRWLEHTNRAFALAAALISVADPEEAAERYARYTGLPTTKHGAAHRLATARGDLLIATPDVWKAFGAMPVAPGIAGYVLECSDTMPARSRAEMHDVVTHDLGSGRFAMAAPAAIGGLIACGPIGKALPDL